MSDSRERLVEKEKRGDDRVWRCLQRENAALSDNVRAKIIADLARDACRGASLPPHLNEQLSKILATEEARIQWWSHTRVPALGNRFPNEAWADGDEEEVMAIVKSYSDPSYS